MGSSGSKKSKSFINSSYNLDKNKPYSNEWNSQQSNTEPPLKMPIQQTFKCNQCGMIFPTDEALFKHRTRFCIGLKDSGIGRQPIYSDDEDINGYTNRSSFRKTKQNPSPIDKKRDEVNEWKNQRSMLQSVQDMEDRILRDSHKTQKLANDLKKRTHDYNQILIEYEQLQAHERDLLRQMFNLQGQSGSNINYHPNGLTENDKSQLEVLQRQNARLEHERRIIQNKLEDLIASNHQTLPMQHYEPYRLLRDMKAQEDENERTLSILRKRLINPDNLLSTSYDSLSLPYVNSHRRTGDDVRALYNGYLQSGGYDVEILARYSDLDRRLRQYETYPWMKDYPEPLRHYRYRTYRPIDNTTKKLITAKNENERLQNNLDDMQRKFDRLDSRTRQLELTLATSGAFDHKSNGYHSYPSSQVDHYPPINSLTYTSRQPHTNYDNEVFNQQRQYHQTSLPTLDIRTTSHRTQPMNLANNSNITKLRDPFEPQPYDPINGFVLFFDFIMNFPPEIDQCRLITCLHHPQSGLGEPSQLQPFKSELHIDDTNGERIGIALIATKQPVPGCPPQQALSIVLEVQVTTRQVPNEPLRTNAWTKIPLFDHKNRLLSGRWKTPLKKLPIHQDESFAVISTFPTFGRAELHYRLVNFQDAAEQSNALLSPNFRDLYFYPPQD